MLLRHLFRLVRVCCCCLPLSAAPVPSPAGPWLQDTGRGFAAASITYRRDLIALQGLGAGADLPVELGYFAEYGLHPRWTVGLDLNVVRGSSAHALVFLRHPLPSWGEIRIAADLALGVNQAGSLWVPMQRVGLSFGRGFQADLRGQTRSGWWTVDLRHEWRDKGLSRGWKLDATVGLNRDDGWAPMIQLETGKSGGESHTLAVIPSLRRRIGPQDHELVLGVEYKRARQRSLGLRLGLWQRF